MTHSLSMTFRTIAMLLACSMLGVACTRGTPDPLAQPDGEWLFINYWAEWCKPCIEEIPQLNALDSTYDQVTVLGVNYDGAEGADLAQQRMLRRRDDDALGHG